MVCVCAFLFCSPACAAGATEHLPWKNEVQEDAGRALVMGTDQTVPALAPVRNTQALHKHTGDAAPHLSIDRTGQVEWIAGKETDIKRTDE